jgi:hypothetical protein
MSEFQKLEFQKIAVGLLGMSHPEIHRSRIASPEPAKQTLGSPALKPTRGSKATRGSKPAPATAALRGLKFALAALLAGARSIPLGDNGRITRELGEYGIHLKGC